MGAGAIVCTHARALPGANKRTQRLACTRARSGMHSSTLWHALEHALAHHDDCLLSPPLALSLPGRAHSE
eukprot:1215900-Pleurochrysis_carterae.AAC.1